MSEINIIRRIKNEYFFSIIQDVNHYSDCRIYKSSKQLCDCGLIYHLEKLTDFEPSILFNNYYTHLTIQEGYEIVERQPGTMSEVLEEIFDFKRIESIDIQRNFDYMYKILDEFFTEKVFPNAYLRLNKWFKNEINNL